jgi:hypothetical protein
VAEITEDIVVMLPVDALPTTLLFVHVRNTRLGQVDFRRALAWIPTDRSLYVLIDDTLARKTGKGVSLATMHHDPLLSTARKPFCSFGHVWVVLAIWVPLPMGGTRGIRRAGCTRC